MRLLLPDFLRQQGYTASKIVYRTRNKRVSMPSEIGIPIPFDSGTLGFLLARADGSYSAGTAMGETMYIQSRGTSGLWRLRLFATAIAPAASQPQADARAALERATGGLELSPQFFALWNQAFAHTPSRSIGSVSFIHLTCPSELAYPGRHEPPASGQPLP